MTKAIELAKKCGATEGLALYYFTLEELQAFYDAAQKEQMEKDAKICEACADFNWKMSELPSHQFHDMYKNLAAGADECENCIRQQSCVPEEHVKIADNIRPKGKSIIVKAFEKIRNQLSKENDL